MSMRSRAGLEIGASGSDGVRSAPGSGFVRRALLLGAAALLAVAGCATPPPASDPDAVADFKQINDPAEPLNRAIFSFNQAVDARVLRPVALTYRTVVPQFGRDRVSDFLDNLKDPLYFANDLLQGNVGLAGQTAERFALNSTFGVLGIMDVAAPLGVPPHESDFGQTLGVWGLNEGPYLVLPLLGPSNPRDAVGLAAEWVADPVSWYAMQGQPVWSTAHTRFSYLTWVRLGMTTVSKEEAYMDVLDDVRRTSLDYYAATRSLYRQRRASQVRAGKHPEAGAGPARHPKAGSAQSI